MSNTTFHHAASGFRWMLLSQFLLTVGQFVYSAITARVFTPAEFGSFTAALSLQGILALLTTTGLPAFVLRSNELTAGDVRTIRALAVVGGVLASGLYLILSAPWLILLNAPDGRVFVIVLGIAQFIGPTAVVESALLRREGRPRQDALTLFAAFAGSAGVGVAFIVLTDELWTLGLAAVLNPIILGTLAWACRRARFENERRLDRRSLFGYMRTITMQNVAFLIIQQTPGWFISARLGVAGLGNYARASTITMMPGAALSAALNKSIQPHWRKIKEAGSMDRAVREAVVLSAGLAFPIFAVLAVTGPDITALWLGPGWETAGRMVPLLAIAYGMSIPFGVLANSAEMRGLFRPVRVAQCSMALVLAAPLILLVITGNIMWAPASMAFAQITGLVVLVLFQPWVASKTCIATLRSLGIQAIFAAGIASVGYLVGEWIVSWQYLLFGSEEVTRVLTTSVVSCLGIALTFRWNEISTVLAARGYKLNFLRLPIG